MKLQIEKKLIAVLLTCHNRQDKTLDCLCSLYNSIAINNSLFDVYLVDDGSSDGTSDAVLSSYPTVNIIQGDGNLYWNGGMYKAWQEASKRDYCFYLWLNDDTMLNNNALSILIDCSLKLDDKNIIVGSTNSRNKKNIITYGGRNRKSGLIKPTDKTQTCDYFNGNIVLIPRYVFCKIGMNDPSFKHAFGDFDYGLRASKFGILSYVAPGVLGECDDHGGLPQWCNPKTNLGKRLKLLYSPLGNNPFESFKFEKRHNGFILACNHFITNHLRALFPIIWVKK
jgi:GT2 family glycosyltransferase